MKENDPTWDFSDPPRVVRRRKSAWEPYVLQGMENN